MAASGTFIIQRTTISCFLVSFVSLFILFVIPASSSDITRMVCDCRPVPTKNQGTQQSLSGKKTSISSKVKNQEIDPEDGFEKEKGTGDSLHVGNTFITGEFRRTKNRSGNDESGNSAALKTISNDAGNRIGGVFVY